MIIICIYKKLIYLCKVSKAQNLKKTDMKITRTKSELKKAVAVLKRTYFNSKSEIGTLIYVALNNVKTNEDLDILFTYNDTYQKTKESSVKKSCLECIQLEFIDL